MQSQKTKTILITASVVLASMWSAALYAQTNNIVRVSNFNNGISGWKVQRISKKVAATKFTVKKIDGVFAVQAYADKSMALLIKRMSVNLSQTPILCWRWRVNRTVAGADITKKSGDDQAARLYIGLDLPNSKIPLGTRIKLAAARGRTKGLIPDGAINYVWDNKLPVGTARPNVYTKQARIIVMESGNNMAGKWVNERRNLANDINRQFKTNAAQIQSIAISSDTDNSGGSVTAAFADIHFTSGKCKFK